MLISREDPKEFHSRVVLSRTSLYGYFSLFQIRFEGEKDQNLILVVMISELEGGRLSTLFSTASSFSTVQHVWNQHQHFSTSEFSVLVFFPSIFSVRQTLCSYHCEFEGNVKEYTNI